jgi:hypothetical protein
MKLATCLALATTLLTACSLGDSGPETTDDSIALDISEGTASVSCPIGETCDASYFYHAYTYRDDHLSLYLSFAPNVVGATSVEAFRESFDYANVFVYFSDGFEWQTREPLRQITIDALEGNRLRGSLSTSIDGTVISSSESCQQAIGGDGPLPDDCVQTLDQTIPLTVTFDLALPDVP